MKNTEKSLVTNVPAYCPGLGEGHISNGLGGGAEASHVAEEEHSQKGPCLCPRRETEVCKDPTGLVWPLGTQGKGTHGWEGEAGCKW